MTATPFTDPGKGDAGLREALENWLIEYGFDPLRADLLSAALTAKPSPILARLATAEAARLAVEAERDEARRALERDRSKVAAAVSEMRVALKGRAWLLEGGRGPYAWDDDRFREEFSGALDEIAAPLEKLRDIARDWSNCPTDRAEIEDARTDWKLRVEAAEAKATALAEQVARLTEALHQIARASPEPDDKEWHDPIWHDRAGYKFIGANGEVHETSVDDSNSGDVENFGYERGLHAAAMIARAVLTNPNGGARDADAR